MDNGKHVLVCGGAGYIGSHMVRTLVEKGWEPVVFDNLSTGHHESVEHESVTLIRGDLMDKQSLRRVFAEYSFDAVVHFAGLIAVGESVCSPLTYYQNNVAGTLNLVVFLHGRGLRQSRDKAYFRGSSLPSLESLRSVQTHGGKNP